MSIGSQQILKKDHIIIEYKQVTNSESISASLSLQGMTRMGIYALLYNGTTYVIQSVWKTQLNVPILSYYETSIFPKVLVDSVFNFETMMKRNVSLRRNNKYQPHPQRIQSISTINTQKDFTNNIIIQEINPDLIDLEITIKTQKYISLHPYEKLLKIVEIMTSF